MRPPKFDYYRPETIGEAIELLSTHENAKALAGGHSLIPAMNLRLAQPDVLVDLGRLDSLRAITLTDHSVMIGALCTHAQVASSPDVQRYSAALASAAGKIGDAQVRNWGTIGGNLAHADPAADLPTAVLACGGILHLQGSDGERAVAADDFFVDLFTVDLMPGELIVSVELPIMGNTRSAYAKLPHPASHYALVGVGVALAMDGDRCTSARVAVGGSVPKATRSPGAESALQGATLDTAAIDRATAALVDDIADSLMGDLFAPEEYRKIVTQVYFRRAVQAALGNDVTGGM
jgi:aerobic carbon-monoxide dehydrogenase medium subunit